MVFSNPALIICTPNYFEFDNLCSMVLVNENIEFKRT